MAVDVDHHLVLAARDARTVVEEADAQVFVLVVHLARGRIGDHVALVVERGVAPVGQYVAVREISRAGVEVIFAGLVKIAYISDNWRTLNPDPTPGRSITELLTR